MLLLATAVVLTGCRVAEHGRRAAIDAFASFVLDSVLRVQQAAPLTQAAPPTQANVECAGHAGALTAAARPPHSTKPLPLPRPVSLVASVDLAPKVELCRTIRIRALDLARAKVEAHMVMAEMRGTRGVRIVVVVPEVEIPSDPTSL